MTHLDQLAGRLADRVSAKLGTPILFVRWWHDNRTGADVPVFQVPARLYLQAVELGLTVEVDTA